MARVLLGVGAGQAVSTADIILKYAYLTGGSANSTATIISADGKNLPLAALIGSMGFVPSAAVGNSTNSGAHLQGPVTATVVGTGAQLVIEW